MNFNVIALTETWLRDYEHLINYVQISGYNFEYNICSTGQPGGGVSMYIKENVNYKRRQDIINIDKSVEHLWIEVRGCNNNSYLIGVFYQPSSEQSVKELWLAKFDNILAQISIIWDGPIVIAGDFHINLLNSGKKVAKRYDGILDTFNLQQLNSYPTRKGKKLIDHIITNTSMKPICENLVPTDEISDHDMPFVILNIKSPKFQPCYKMICDFKNFELENCIKNFERLPLSLAYASDDSDDQVRILNDLILCINKHAPLKRTKITSPPAPWNKSVSIKYLQSERIKLRKIAYETKNENDMQNNRLTRICLTQTIKAEK